MIISPKMGIKVFVVALSSLKFEAVDRHKATASISYIYSAIALESIRRKMSSVP